MKESGFALGAGSLRVSAKSVKNLVVLSHSDGSAAVMLGSERHRRASLQIRVVLDNLVHLVCRFLHYSKAESSLWFSVGFRHVTNLTVQVRSLILFKI